MGLTDSDRMKKITIRELARHAGVSKSTVSRALNNQQEVAPEVRKHILSLAAELKYCNTALRKSPAIAVISNWAQYGQYRTRLEYAVCQAIEVAGGCPFVVSEKGLELVSEIIFSGAISICSEDRIAGVWSRQKSCPLVCINDFSRHIDQIYTVRSDPKQGQRLIVEHLAGLGHTRIGMMRRDRHFSLRSSHLTQEGFLEAMAAKGLESTAFYRTFAEPAEFPDAMDWLLKQQITALIVMGEGYAIQAGHLLKQHGCRIPDDISLVTQGMEYMTEFLAPPQTAVMQDFELLAQKSVEMLWELMRRRTVSEDILIPAKLIIRESTAPPPEK